MQVVEDFGSRPHKAVTFVVQRGKAGMERAKIAEGVTWIQRRKTTRREARKRKVGKKAKKANKGRRKMRKAKKELEALRGRPSKDKIPFTGGIAR